MEKSATTGVAGIKHPNNAKKNTVLMFIESPKLTMSDLRSMLTFYLLTVRLKSRIESIVILLASEVLFPELPCI